MPETIEAIRPSAFADAARPLALRIAAMADRLRALLAAIAPGGGDPERGRFLAAIAQQYAEEARRPDPAGSVLIRLADAFELTGADLDLLVLAGLPEEHEGFCQVLRSLHPRGEPRPTAALAAKIVSPSVGGRQYASADAIGAGALAGSGCVRMAGDGPAPERSLVLADALWPVVGGADIWPAALDLLGRDRAPAFAASWFDRADVGQAITLLQQGGRITILLLADDEEAALEWGVALADAARVRPQTLAWPLTPSRDLQQLLSVHAAARGCVPVLRVKAGDDPQAAPHLTLTDAPGAAIVCARAGFGGVRGSRPIYPLAAPRIGPADQRRLWATVLPEIQDEAPRLAARYALTPALAREVAGDVRARAVDRRPTVDDVAASVRARATVPASSGVTIVRPSATWDHLVLRPSRLAQLREAVARLHHQARVLDEWKFLDGRPGRRGVRMLFAGPPGTGKTLSAEVLAAALGTDLIVADVSRLVSKWIGETPKNLGRVFDLAERSTGVILFDEADALFGKRTSEAADANDRHANLETAFLLSRLERFEGLAILASNLQQNIDTAFMRRLEFIVDFEDPGVEERERLWERHIPSRTLLAADVTFAELAGAYAVTGALIRNAAVAAAFLASAAGTVITRTHLTHAMRREYDKSGLAFPGNLPGTAGYPHTN